MDRLDSLINLNITEKIDELAKLEESITHFLAINTHQINIWPVLNKRKLTIFTDQPMLLTRIHFDQQSILDHLSKTCNLTIDALDSKLLPSQNSRNMNLNRSKNIFYSTKMSNSVTAIAKTIDDEELQNLLIDLTKTSTKD